MEDLLYGEFKVDFEDFRRTFKHLNLHNENDYYYMVLVEQAEQELFAAIEERFTDGLEKKSSQVSTAAQSEPVMPASTATATFAGNPEQQ